MGRAAGAKGINSWVKIFEGVSWVKKNYTQILVVVVTMENM